MIPALVAAQSLLGLALCGWLLRPLKLARDVMVQALEHEAEGVRFGYDSTGW